jgi:S1-C subfamily serine protease
MNIYCISQLLTGFWVLCGVAISSPDVQPQSTGNKVRISVERSDGRAQFTVAQPQVPSSDISGGVVASFGAGGGSGTSSGMPPYYHLVTIQSDASRGERPSATGTGFFITDDGYLLTNYHVVQGSTRIVVRTAADTLPAVLVRGDPANDLALLKLSGTFHALPIAPSRLVRLGDPIFTIGFPNIALQGIEPKLTRGEVNSLAGIRDDPRHFQISVPVQPGSSGGPLVDRYGNVIGMVALRLDDIGTLKSTGSLPQNVNYAIKSSLLTVLTDAVPEILTALKPVTRAKEPDADQLVTAVRQAVALVLVFGNGSLPPVPSLAEIAQAYNDLKYATAEILARKRLEQEPEDIAALFCRGIALYKMGNLDDALSALRRASQVTTDKNTFPCLATTFLGLCHFSKWVASNSPNDRRLATEILAKAPSCPSTISTTDNSPMGRLVWLASLAANGQREGALTVLSDLNGEWIAAGDSGRRSNYRLRQSNGIVEFSRLDANGGGYAHRLDARLQADAYRLSGSGTESFIVVLDSAELSFRMSLELSADFHSLRGTKTYTKCTGRGTLCARFMQDPVKQVEFRRK